MIQDRDERKIAVYARKSKITETGKSIENQINKCKSYAYLKFDTSEDDILVYKDEGLSGFYSDRPDYMRMLHDISENKLRAVICYKFDRISRRTLDLLNLVEQLKTKKIAFISCTDDVDTSTKTGRIIMSLLASIAEFERDIIAERITDNMYELAKDGRWLGGTTPTGFYSKKTYLSIGNKKTSINHLEPIPLEQDIVKIIFNRFLTYRSVQNVVDFMENEGKRTKKGSKHTRVSIKDILSNPVYAIADSESYKYFKSFDVPIYADESDFNGINGLMVYNKTDQMKELKDDSTAILPKYIQKTEKREIKEWIVSVGKHQGIISGAQWILVQSLLQGNKDKFVRPNEKTESLLSGLIVCPLCGKNMFTHRESNRFTAGKPRFLYKCQTKREDKSECNYKDVKGNEIDQFVIDAIISMSSENNEYYYKLTENEALLESKSNTTTTQLKQLEKSITKLNKEISNQAQNLRIAKANIKQIILDDLSKMSEELAEIEKQKQELTDNSKNLLTDAQILQKAREIIFSFPKLIDFLSFQDKMELLRKVIDKVFVINNGEGDDEVHIFLKGTPESKYKDFFAEVHGRSDLCVTGKYLIFNTSGSISCKPGTFIGIKCGNSFN